MMQHRDYSRGRRTRTRTGGAWATYNIRAFSLAFHFTVTVCASFGPGQIKSVLLCGIARSHNLRQALCKKFRSPCQPADRLAGNQQRNVKISWWKTRARVKDRSALWQVREGSRRYLLLPPLINSLISARVAFRPNNYSLLRRKGFADVKPRDKPYSAVPEWHVNYSGRRYFVVETKILSQWRLFTLNRIT